MQLCIINESHNCAYVKNGQGWEGDIQQANIPYASKNHVAQCGKINTFYFNSSDALVSDF